MEVRIDSVSRWDQEEGVEVEVSMLLGAEEMVTAGGHSLPRAVVQQQDQVIQEEVESSSKQMKSRSMAVSGQMEEKVVLRVRTQDSQVVLLVARSVEEGLREEGFFFMEIRSRSVVNYQYWAGREEIVLRPYQQEIVAKEAQEEVGGSRYSILSSSSVPMPIF